MLANEEESIHESSQKCIVLNPRLRAAITSKETRLRGNPDPNLVRFVPAAAGKLLTTRMVNF